MAMKTRVAQMDVKPRKSNFRAALTAEPLGNKLLLNAGQNDLPSSSASQSRRGDEGEGAFPVKRLTSGKRGPPWSPCGSY
jgi:hypothetical protein